MSLEVFVSVQTVSEARLAARYRCIVDVKNPRRGSLGAASLRQVALVEGVVRPLRCPLSVALGDGPPWQTADEVHVDHLVASLDVQFVKLGLAGVVEMCTSVELFDLICETVVRIRRANRHVAIMLGTFADYHRCAAPPPGQLVELAALCGADGVLVDTYEKRPNESLFTHLTWRELYHLRYRCGTHALRFAVAGNLQPGHVFLLKNVQPHYVGFRSALTRTGSRRSTLDEQKLASLCDMLFAARQVLRA